MNFLLNHFRYQLNLQYFAADQGGEGGQADQQADQQQAGETQSQQDQQQEKMLPQSDVNNLIAKETKKAQEKLLKQLGIDDFNSAKEGLQKFKEWQDSQKTEQQKQQEALENLTKEKETLSTENATLKAQLSALKQGVKAESVEDVVALAERLVNDETSIDDAIKQVVEKYPHFAQQQEESQSKPTFTTGQHQTEGHSNNDPFAAKLAKYQN